MFSIADAVRFCSSPPDLVERWPSADGTRLTLRPVHAQDAPAMRNMLEGLSPSDRRCRFHGAVNGVSAARLVHMVCVDQQRHRALVVTARHSRDETIVADARYVADSDGQCAEFAIVVAGLWQRRGIGRRAITALLRAASRSGLQRMRGAVLPDNTPMLALMRACGFTCTLDRDDDVVWAEIHVPTHGAARALDTDAAWRGRSDAWTQFC